MTAQKFWNLQAEWSQKTFGTDSERGPVGALKHLEKEAREAIEERDHDRRSMEIVDCLFLVYDAARRHGLTFEWLYSLAAEKLEINKNRTWQKVAGDEPSEHVR